MEQLREENHKLQLKLDQLKKTHSTEIEYLKEELEIKDRDFKSELAKLREDSKSREALKNEKIQGLTEELQSLREDHDNALQQIEKLRTQVEILKTAKSGGIGIGGVGSGIGSYSDYEGLKESNRILKSQLAEKEELLTSQTEKIRGLGAEVRECREVISRLNEEIEGKDSVVKELHERVKAVEREKEEECGGLQNEVVGLRDEVRRLNGLVGGSGDVVGGGGGGSGGGGNNGGGATTRGNSLFSEVEERRLKVESELSRLRTLVKKLTEEKRILQLELERGDSHNANIQTQLDVITKSEQELYNEFKKDKSESLQLFDSYRDRLDFLRTEYSRKLLQYKNDPSIPTLPSELESLRSDRDALQFMKITLERENNELKRELKFNKHLRTKAEADLKIVKANLDNEKLKRQQQQQQTNATTTGSSSSSSSSIQQEDLINENSNNNNVNVNNINAPSTNDSLLLETSSSTNPLNPQGLKIKPQSQECAQQ